MRCDMAILHEAIKTGHPVAGRYHSSAYLDSCAAATQAQLTSPLTERQFRAVLLPYVAALGCGHTSLQPLGVALKGIRSAPPFVLPLRLWADSSRLFVVAAPGIAAKKVRPGDEIISLDQHPAAAVVRGIMAAIPTDGFNQTHRHYILQRSGTIYYALVYGLRDTYELTLRDAAYGRLRTIRLSQADVDTAAVRLAARPAPPVIAGAETWRQEKFGALSVLPGTPAVAVLKLRTLTGKQRKFYRAAFAEIRQRGIRHLVLDLRGNGGGNVFTGNALLRYLLPRPYYLVLETSAVQRRLRRRLQMDFWERITPALLSLDPNQRWANGRHQFRFRFRPHPQRFAGQVLVLTDGGTFSMGSYLAAYLQQLGGATVVGAETGGGASGANAMLQGYLLLPESHLRLRVPVYRIVHQTGQPDTRQGVLPDVSVRPTLDDLLQQRDPVLEAARALVK